MIKFLRRGGVLASSVLCASVLVAYGSASASSPRSSGQVINLSFWNGLTGPDKPAVDYVISQFNKTHPTIHVTSDPIPWAVLYAKLLPAFAAGKGPNLVGLSTDNLPEYASKHVIRPLTSFFSNGVSRSSIVSAALNAGVYQGQVYGVPVESTPALLYYNKKLFKAAHIAGPPTNWAQWAADAKKLTILGGTDGNPKQYGMSIGTNDTLELFPTLMWMANGGVMSPNGKQVMLDSAASKRAIKYWATLINKDHISPFSQTGADADTLFGSSKAAMEVNGPWATTGYKQAGINFGLAPVPTGPNGKHISVGTTTDLVVSSADNAAQTKAAAEFYAFWISKAQQIKYSLTAGFPPVTNNVPTSALRGNPAIAKFAAQSNTTRAIAPGQTTFASIENDVFDPTIEKIIANPGQLNSLLSQAATQVKSTIAGG